MRTCVEDRIMKNSNNRSLIQIIRYNSGNISRIQFILCLINKKTLFNGGSRNEITIDQFISLIPKVLYSWFHGFFQTSQSTSMSRQWPSHMLQQFFLQNVDLYIDNISRKLNLKNFSRIVAPLYEKKYDVIIDGANVGRANNGTMVLYHISKMVQTLEALGKTPLVIIHKNHRLNLEHNMFHPPSRTNDDLFILLAFLISCKKNVFTHIITNDQYTDHITEFSYSSNNDFRDFLTDSLTRYTVSNFVCNIDAMHNFSRCIQVMDDGTMVCPTRNGLWNIY
jgi:hypothetical protein